MRRYFQKGSYGRVQKLLTGKVMVKRMCAKDMRRPKTLVIYKGSANLSESYRHLVFATGTTFGYRRKKTDGAIFLLPIGIAKAGCGRLLLLIFMAIKNQEITAFDFLWP